MNKPFEERAKEILERQIDLLVEANEQEDNPEQLRKNAETIMVLIGCRLPIDRKFNL